MATEIPVTNDARQTMRILLAGQQVQLRLWWQPADGYWYLTVSYPGGEAITEGARVTAGGNALAGGNPAFRGRIVAVPTQDDSALVEPGREAWGVTHRLLFEAPTA